MLTSGPAAPRGKHAEFMHFSCLVCSTMARNLSETKIIGQGLDAGDLVELHDGETLRLMHARWMKLYKDLFSAKKGTFDISKIPDVYDCAKYDAIHNQKNLGLKSLPTLYDTSRCLSEFIAPSEYGMTRKQKLDIGVTICRNLMKKIMSDIESCLPRDQHAESDDEEQAVKLNMDYLNNDLESKQIKTRLYFTSESHIHSVRCKLHMRITAHAFPCLCHCHHPSTCTPPFLWILLSVLTFEISNNGTTQFHAFT